MNIAKVQPKLVLLFVATAVAASCGGRSDLESAANACAPDEARCDDLCVALENDPHHCGGCATSCPAGAACVNGACAMVCGVGQLVCSSSCANITNDNAHCGACDNACPLEATCSGGTCQCKDPTQIACGVTCVDVRWNGQNCGRCGNDCNGGTCVNTRCLVTLDQGPYPERLVVDTSNVYWSAGSQISPAIHAVPINGGPSMVLVPGVVPIGLAVRSGRLYFKDVQVAHAPLARLSTDGGAVEYLSAASGPIGGIPLVDDSYAYLMTNRIPLDGGAPQQLIADGGAGGSYAEALDAKNLYWLTGSQLQSVSLAGGPLKVLASNLNNPSALAIDDTDAYWTTYGNSGAVQKTALVGGQAIYTLADQLVDAASVVVDETSVYVSVQGDNAIIKLPKTGGAVSVLISTQLYAPDGTRAWGMAVDATSLYWAGEQGVQWVSARAEVDGTPHYANLKGGSSLTVETRTRVSTF